MRALCLERVLQIALAEPGCAVFRDGTAVYLALDPRECLSLHDGAGASALDSVGAAIDALRSSHAEAHPHAFGWISYDALRADDPTLDADARPRADAAPVAHLTRYAAVLRVDLRDGALLARGEPGACARLERAWRLAATLAPLAALAPLTVSSRTDEAQHHAAVETLREHIYDGAYYLVNYARVLHADRDEHTRAQLIARLARADAKHLGYFEGPEATVAGSSMELGLSFRSADRMLRTGPIKGTRPRGETLAVDEQNARELAADPKERAENVMAVDVHRNDLGRVAVAASVEVDALCTVEPHRYVHHLVSTVRATARADVRVQEILAAVLPLGSVTGAPKRAAMEAIGRLEPEQRGVYTGVYGAVSADGSFTFAVAIRTAVLDHRGVHYGVGGGIVAASDPSREWQELQWKSRGFCGA